MIQSTYVMMSPAVRGYLWSTECPCFSCKAGVCFTLATAEELSSVSFITAPVPSEYTEEERHILLVIPQWTSDMLTMLGRVTCYFSLLLGRDDAFRDPDRIRLCLEVEFPLQCNDWRILGFAG